VQGIPLLLATQPQRLYSFVGTPSGKGYLNLGWWEKDGLDPALASEELVRELGRFAGLAPDDRVLDVGFGFGHQDLVWAGEFGCRHILGLDITASQTREARQRAMEAAASDAIGYLVGDAVDIPFAAGTFDKVVALECAFHFRTRKRFLREAFRVLEPGGVLALSDIVRGRGAAGAQLRDRSFGRLVERFWQIPPENRHGRETYVAQLRDAGFEAVDDHGVNDKVLEPFMDHYLGRLVRRHPRLAGLAAAISSFCRSGYLEYVLVRARKKL
jgi:ubiquinone/menaquinone biosynthesis C-methylase UbiE